MKFLSQLTAACLATGAYAAAIVPRDAQTIKDVLAKVQNDVDSLDGTVKQFNGDPNPVLSASDNLISTIGTGADQVKGTSDVTDINDAFSLLAPVDELKAHVRTLADDFNAKEPAVAAAKACGATRERLDKIGSNTQTLVDNIVSKVPQSTQGIARDRGNGIIQILNEVKANYAADKCVDA
ncbi:hypothetical protein CDD82_465 [Ophiocordyceps australis]|uniref:Hydrophobic surface binding protein n=1 Tax=Ophiocordyceps australis TaxID=1399860 RepID=A0A2C5XRP7_9HYPO|nr:hypothetical protein CDD82_465 [Ophiocordyceps australis]